MWSAAITMMASLVLATAVNPFLKDGKFKDVVCPDGSTCPDENPVCCPDNKCCASNYPVCCPDDVHCCPSGYSTCCSDGLHCCPTGYTCAGTSCLPGAHHPGENSMAAILGRKAGIRKDGNVKNVICPDGQSQCLDGNTCCMLNTGEYGCCPKPNANCCPDQVHCCPAGYICRGADCFKEGTVHPIMELLSSPVHHKEV